MDLLGEIGSGPRFIYMAFPWLVSKTYRETIKAEYQIRNKVLAWIEFIFAAIFFFIWLALGLGLFIILIRYFLSR